MTNLTEKKEERVTRSQSVPYEKSQCIICQKIGRQLRDKRNWSENSRSLAKTTRQRDVLAIKFQRVPRRLYSK